MSEEIRNEEERHGMSPGIAMLMGIGIGIIGTVVVIAANEERFGHAVRRTKKKAVQVKKQVKGKFDEAVNSTRERAVHAAESVERGARRLGEKLGD